MFERYSESARRVIFYSRSMALQLVSPEIETEHLLLALLRADMVLSRRFLGSPWAVEEIWQGIERSKTVRAITTGTGDLPLSATAKRVLHRAAEEADQLSSKKIGTEHLLLGLLGDDKCLAAVLLAGHGLGLVSIREELSQNPHDDAATEKFDAKRAAERETGKRMNPDQEELFHEMVTGQNLGYHDLVT